MQTFIAYYRVSTKRQGESGLGLEAQEAAVQRFVADKGEVIESFTEVESGKRKRRPKMLAALEACRRRKATLVIAKLDRLARNVYVVSGLMESRVPFVCCDNPHVRSDTPQGRMMLHVLASMAEFEAGMISLRTKEAKAMSYVRRPALKDEERARGRRTGGKNQETAEAFARRMAPLLAELEAKGFRTLMEKAHELNRRNVPTAIKGAEIATGRERWHISTVHRLVKRIERLQAEGAALALAA